MSETTYSDVMAYLSNPNNAPTARERAAAKRESARLEARRLAWEQDRAAHGLPADVFAGF